jgi:hypothetical protein
MYHQIITRNNTRMVFWICFHFLLSVCKTIHTHYVNDKAFINNVNKCIETFREHIWRIVSTCNFCCDFYCDFSLLIDVNEWVITNVSNACFLTKTFMTSTHGSAPSKVSAIPLKSQCNAFRITNKGESSIKGIAAVNFLFKSTEYWIKYIIFVVFVINITYTQKIKV